MAPSPDINIVLCSVGEGYESVGEIGRGSVGVVYACSPLGGETLTGKVAIKLMSPSPMIDIDVFDGIIDAALATRKLTDSVAVVPVLEVGKTPDARHYYIVMKLMDETMERLIGDGPLSFEEKCVFAAEIAKALDGIHSNGIVHGDLKPPNVLLADRKPFLNDFYLAPWRMGGAAASTRGTPYYMSPEQAMGRPVTPSSDIYSLGVLLYELFTGAMPYKTEPKNLSEMIDAVVEGDMSPPSSNLKGGDRRLDGVIMELLGKDPADRPPKASMIAKSLMEIAAGKGAADRKKRGIGAWLKNLLR